MKVIFVFLSFVLISPDLLDGQDHSTVSTRESPFAQLSSLNISDVKWTSGFWAERNAICRDSMVTGMLENYLDDQVSHAFANFEIAAGLKRGKHEGPPFHDGDFYKILEAAIAVNAICHDKTLDLKIDSIIAIISMVQRSDGYIHTPVLIEQYGQSRQKAEFTERLDFETYNMGHLMTAACLHYKTTGKTNFFNIAVKATDFLYNYYQRNPGELAENAICPSHYMGIAEMYRTTGNPRYLELARGLIEIRGMVEDGTDHNQDRIPFKQQRKAVGHAVRATYLYAGAADVFLETGDDSLWMALEAISHDIESHKLYITGAVGALYDGVSPDGTSYNPLEIQQVHQAFGHDYQLPSITAHNESCASIGYLMWNWRMLLATADARYADLMEQTMYNSLLAAVSLDGTGYFYTNPLCVSDDLTYKLRWAKEREAYISYCNCCPPNTIRTIAEILRYFYTVSDKGIWIHFYGGNRLSTSLMDNSPLVLSQKTSYPWDETISILLEQVPEKEFSVFLRIPEWCDEASMRINGLPSPITATPGSYAEIRRKWAKGDSVVLNLPMKVRLIKANPLVEETRNQVAVKRGPVVYCLESSDIPEGSGIFDISLPANIQLRSITGTIGASRILFLEGDALKSNHGPWNNQLYREIDADKPEPVNIRLVPYYAWGNRGHSEMTVWMPLR